jgi:hypothetical protein
VDGGSSLKSIAVKKTNLALAKFMGKELFLVLNDGAEISVFV